jgi:hypothetical protein
MTAAETVPSPTSLRAIDWLLLGYLGIVSIVAALRASTQPECWWLLVAHGLFVLFLVFLTRPGQGVVGRSFRELYPLFLLPALYSELDILNAPSVLVHDRLVQHWELLVFGMQVSREWWQRAPSRFWSAVLHAAYLSYYVIISAPALYYAWKGDLPAVRRFVLVVMTTFVLCYLIFIFFPVAGPYYMFPPPRRLVYRQPAGSTGLRCPRQGELLWGGISVLSCRGLPGGDSRRRQRLTKDGRAARGAYTAADRRSGVLPDALRSRRPGGSDHGRPYNGSSPP